MLLTILILQYKKEFDFEQEKYQILSLRPQSLNS